MLLSVIRRMGLGISMVAESRKGFGKLSSLTPIQLSAMMRHLTLRRGLIYQRQVNALGIALFYCGARIILRNVFHKTGRFFVGIKAVDKGQPLILSMPNLHG